MEKKSCPKCGFTAVGTTSIPASPIPELLNSNAIPDPSQVQSIGSTIKLVQKDLAYLDGQITHFQSILSTLQKERLGLESFLHEHEPFLTPARRIIPDMLSEIFLRYSRGPTRNVFSHIPDSFDSKEGPLVLTQICSEWRQIAISTPKLWTTIRFEINTSTLEWPRRRLVNLWLERSGVCALTVAIIDVSPSYDDLQDFSQNEAFMNICYQSNRWRSAHFSLPASDATWNSFRFIHNKLPLLRDLAIYSSRGRWKWNSTSTFDHFSAAPNLSRLSLDYKTSPSKFELNQRTITFLTYEIHRRSPVSVQVCINGIQNLPHLEESVLHCGGFESCTPYGKAHSFSLKRLTVIADPLREGRDLKEGLGALFLRLFLPALQSLEIISINNSRKWDHSQVLKCISRSPLLQRLVIKCDVINAEQLLEVFRQTPTLTDLTIASSNSIILWVLMEMSRIDESPQLLPKLTQVETIEVPSGHRLAAPYATTDTMISVVTNRSLSPDTSTLQYAKATLSRIRPKVVQYVREAQMATGLDIQLCGRTVICRGTRVTGRLATVQ